MDGVRRRPRRRCLRRFATAALCAACVMPARWRSAALQLNGWHECALDIGSGDTVRDVVAECATVAMPLCHDDVCADADARSLDLFVKRIPAQSASSTRHLWLLPDHPFTTSVEDVERQMILLHQQLQGDVNVYLMDQRGTGRSTRFDCEASQATAAVSAEGVQVAASEAAACAAALQSEFGDAFASAFSITSAARDLVTFISTFQAESSVFLYGVGFGTLLVERAMHFPSHEIVGFVFDSTATTSGGKLKEFAYRSRADEAFGEVALDFLKLCTKDKACSARFGDDSAAKVVTNAMAMLETRESACRTVFDVLDEKAGSTEAASTITASTPPWLGLRRLLAAMLQDLTLRAFIPVVLVRVERCEASDVAVLEALVRQVYESITNADAQRTGAASLVYDLVQFSELWESPSPNADELLERASSATFCRGDALPAQLVRYCAFTRDSADACEELELPERNEATPPLSYSRDKYWNADATIPDTASVLFLHARYDGETPLENALTLYDALQSSRKELLVFESATHNVLANTPLVAVEDRALEATPSCARQVLASFVGSDGDLSAYNVSCVKQLPDTVSFALSDALSIQVLGVADAYDGILPVDGSTSSGSAASTSSDGDSITLPPDSAAADEALRRAEAEKKGLEASRNRYRTALIVVAVVAGLLACVIALLMYRAYKKRKLREEDLQLRKMRGEQSSDDMEFLRDLYNPSPSEWFNYRSNRLHM